MSLTTITTPKTYSLNGNPIPFRLQTDNEYAVSPINGQYDIQVIDFLSPGNTLTLTWNNGSTVVTFTCGPMDDSGLRIRQGATTLQQMAQYLEEALAANAQVYSNYLLSFPAPDTVRLTTRNAASDLNITFTTNQLGTFNFFTIQSSVTGVRRTQFKVYTQLHVRTLGTTQWQRIELLLTPIEGIASFDLGPLLKGDWFSDPLPTLPLNSPQKFRSCIVEYMCRYAEQYGDPSQINRLTSSSVFLCLDGGLSETDHNDQDFNDRYTGPSSSLLISIPGTLYVHIQQSLLLNWLWTAANPYTSARLVGTIHYTDGGSTPMTSLKVIANVQQHSLYTIPLSISEIITYANPNRAISHIQVWIAPPTGLYTINISRIQTFRLRYFQPIATTTFLFKNQFGAYEGITFYGKRIIHEKIDHQYGRRIRPIDQAYKRSISTYSSIATEMTVNSHFIGEAEIPFYRAFASASSIYLIEDNQLIPYRIQPNSLIISESQKYGTYAVQLKLSTDTDSQHPAL